MTEIELKAWVDDRDALINNLNGWTNYVGHVVRKDDYWGLDSNHKKIRVRKENYDNGKSLVLLTYKRKKRVEQNGVFLEVNDERECTVSDSDPLESFLQDNGFEITLHKEKDVMDWTCPVDFVGENGFSNLDLKVTFELCTVPPLGDFLEIEIVSPSDDSVLVAKLREKLEEYLGKCGIPKEKIEPRYYSALLDEFDKKEK